MFFKTLWTMRFLGLIFLLFSQLVAWAQLGSVKGVVLDKSTNEPVPFANILLENSEKGAVSGIEGTFQIQSINPGVYNILCSSVGYKTAVLSEQRVGSVKELQVSIYLEPSVEQLDQVEIVASPFREEASSPNSLRSIGAAEIFRSPGGNRDISRVIQNLPGVASGLSFRNDVIVRGGAPNENRFFVDGVEVPTINHFSTQGSSGGPVGLINVNFIRSVDFYSSAFPVSYGNALSSVIDIKQNIASKEAFSGTFMLGSSDVGLTFDGPTGKNSSLIFSVRRSYLQLLFKALALPFLPTYNDFQVKQEFRVDKQNVVKIIALGAIDQFALNQSVNDDVEDPETFARNQYILGNLPVNEQWNYTAGAVWDRFLDNGSQRVVLSRNHLNNSAIKYRDNIEQDENLILDYQSEEIENKLRYERRKKVGLWEWLYGAGYQWVQYKNSTEQNAIINGAPQLVSYNTNSNFGRYALFTGLSGKPFGPRLAFSFSLRTDFSDYSAETSNPLEQLSPRVAIAYDLTEKLSVNASYGLYYQLPPYPLMGFKNQNNELVNKENGIKYIGSQHFSGGISYQARTYTKISVESFYKDYRNYPFLVNRGISLANVPADFGVLGNEEANANSRGEAYGIELIVQQKLSKRWYGILSYTWVRSFFAGQGKELLPSAWDNQHILNVTAGLRLPRDWELGFRLRYLGGAPFTPYDRESSLRKENWDVSQQGILDYSMLNSQRLPSAYGLDIRIDKTYYFKKWSLNAYLDIQNVTNAQVIAQPFLDVQRDAEGRAIEDPNNPNRYLGRNIENTSGTLLPSIGVMVEF